MKENALGAHTWGSSLGSSSHTCKSMCSGLRDRTMSLAPEDKQELVRRTTLDGAGSLGQALQREALLVQGGGPEETWWGMENG